MASLRLLDPSLATPTAATARPRLVPAPSAAGALLRRRGALLPRGRRRGFSCRAGPAASEM
jgi:hypothetical protein